MIIKNRANYGFLFSIERHVDDINVLYFIQKQLGLGPRVAIKGNAYFTVVKKDEI